jgi:tRNA modification GTPase
MVDSTIAAVASPAGTGGISIIRISGPSSIPIAASIFRSASKKDSRQPPPDSLASHRLYYGHIFDHHAGRALDEVLLGVMRAPRSYTREDVVEVNCHGGPAAVRAILDLILRKGARLAEPGEFTRRAFLNGRIDLTQAEAVIDIINARTDQAFEAAVVQANGALRQELERVREALIEILTRNEAAIDFPEEEDVGPDDDASQMAQSLRQNAVRAMEQLLHNYRDGRSIREGLTVAIVGRPNVGKSSLMNRLLGRERAIVTPHPGTTRDAIEDELVLKGVSVRLWDTAGLHQDSADPVEAIGIQKSLDCIDHSDLLLFVLEAHRPVAAEDIAIYSKIRSRPLVFVLNKVDLVAGSLRPCRYPWDQADCASVSVSALTGRGLEDLRGTILKHAGGDGCLEKVPAVIPNLRQKSLIEECLRSAEAAAERLGNHESPELVDVYLKQAIDKIDEILGSGAKTDIIDRIFSRFCIGK